MPLAFLYKASPGVRRGKLRVLVNGSLVNSLRSCYRYVSATQLYCSPGTYAGLERSGCPKKVKRCSRTPRCETITGCPGSLLLCNNITMATVPSAGCLLAKNQYYRTRLNSDSSVSSSSSSCYSDPTSFSDQEKNHHGLPEIFEKCWWIKSFFHSEPTPPNVGRKTLSASSTNS